jgi:glycine oxidase
MVQSANCITIGGGVVGLTIAWRLARAGASVTLLERAECGREASWAGAGVLSPPNPHRKDAVAQLQLRSLAMYPAFCETLLATTGIDPEYERCGELELAFDETGLRSLRSDAEAAAGRALPAGEPSFEMLDPQAAREFEPAASPEILGAMLCRETAQVRNPRLLRALQQACTAAGVNIREHTPVQTLLRDGNRVHGVRVGIAAGEELLADTVILCGGAWSSQLDDRLQTLMPVIPVRGQMLLMQLDRRPFKPIIARGKTYLVPRRDGHVLLGATEEKEAGFEKRCTPKGINSLITKGLQLVPSLAQADVVGTWSGLRPGTPDDMPYIGPVPGFDGLIAATGHFRTGLSLAPATAEVVLSIMENRAYDLDLSAAAPGRH